MSETVHYKGKLKRLNLENENKEDCCKRICNQNNIFFLKSYNRNWEEELENIEYNKYYINNNDVYETNLIEVNEEDDIFEIDKELNYTIRFYNGGCCVSEALDEALMKANWVVK